MPVTVWAPGWAQNPTAKAQKTSKVGAVKQPRKRSSRLQTERGRLRVGIGGDLWFGRPCEEAADACLLTGTQATQPITTPLPAQNYETPDPVDSKKEAIEARAAKRLDARRTFAVRRIRRARKLRSIR